MIQEQRRGAWTTGEESRLRSLYPNTPIAQLVSVLNRPMSAIYGKAKSLGLKRSDEFKASEHSGRLRAENNPGVATRFQKGHSHFRDRSASAKTTKLRQEQTMEIKTEQFVTGSNERVLTDDGEPGMRGVAGIGSASESCQGQVAAAIYANCARLDNRQLDEIIAWVHLYKK